MKHPAESDLALFATGDVSLWQKAALRLHVAGCRACQNSVDAFKLDRERRRKSADTLPALTEGMDWDALAAEMTANIHLGLEAGECVTPKDRRIPIFKPNGGWIGQSWGGRFWSGHWGSAWKPAAVAAGLTVVMVGAWWLNMPASDTQSLFTKLRSITSGRRTGSRMALGVAFSDDRMPMLEVNATGISVRENGSALGMSQGRVLPVAVSVNVQGSASAHYVDDDTGQVTVTSVYVQ